MQRPSLPLLSGAAALLLLSACSKNAPAPAAVPPQAMQVQSSAAASSEGAPAVQAPPLQNYVAPTLDAMADSRLVELSVDSNGFAPKTIRASQGDKLTLRLTSVGGAHTFTSAALQIHYSLQEGETKDILIPTTSIGTFDFWSDEDAGTVKGKIVIS
jgi:plastocyanin